MEFLLDIILLLIVILVVFFGQLILLLPGRVLKVARKNYRRSNGSFSRGRWEIEARELLDVCGNIFVGFLIILTVTVAPMTLIHEYVIPIPMMADIFGAFKVDSTEWEAAIETEELGDVGARYEAWGAEKGYSGTQLRFWQEFLWAYWAPLIGLIAAITFLLYLFTTRFYSKALTSYSKDVFDRREYYQTQAGRKSRSHKTSSGSTPASDREAR